MNFPSATILLVASSLVSCSAFLGIPMTSSSTMTQITMRKASSKLQNNGGIQLYSSKNDEEEEEEPLSDELSKLIGKRASMISSKKESAPASQTVKTSIPSDNEEGAILDPSVESLYEGKTGMDIFDMPDFKTKRPLRTPKETEDKARGGDGKDDSEDYIDFMADYDDENDLHIPNRIGASTIAWGNTDLGFKAGKKLKKKEIKAGKYLPGDLQVSSK